VFDIIVARCNHEVLRLILYRHFNKV